MRECPFLSTYDSNVECFRDCALYNYKDNGGMCPFTNLMEYNSIRSKSRNDLIESIERDLGFIRESYLERDNQYL